MTPEEQTYITERKQMQELVTALRAKGADYQEAKRRLVEAYLQEHYPELNFTVTPMKATMWSEGRKAQIFADLKFDLDLATRHALVPGQAETIYREIEAYLDGLLEEK